MKIKRLTYHEKEIARREATFAQKPNQPAVFWLMPTPEKMRSWTLDQPQFTPLLRLKINNNNQKVWFFRRVLAPATKSKRPAADDKLGGLGGLAGK